MNITLADNGNCLHYSENPEQLEKLLSEIEIQLKLKGVEKYFDDDKEKRAVYLVTIKRGSIEISFDFGSSLVESCAMFPRQYDTKTVNTILAHPFKRLSICESKKFYGKESIEKAKKKFLSNAMYSILCCCKSDYYYPIDFDEFCSVFGYNNDSIRAKKTWEDCLKQKSKLEKVFCEKEIEFLPS